MSEISVARQPIYDKELNVFAYELLFDGDGADSADLVSTFGSMGLKDLVGSRPAFVRVSESFLYDALSLQLPSHRLILEIADGAEETVRSLKERGYIIASSRPEFELADIVKLDVALGQRLAPAPGKQTLAVGVATHEDLELSKSLGFDYFQGGFLCQPKAVSKRTVPTNRMAKLGLLAELNDPDADFDALEKIIGRDVGLSYRFLRYINSAFFSLPHKVGSIRQALVLLGISAVKKWATLLAMSDLEDKPNELIVTALVRAKMCELTAASRPAREREEHFTTGMFSVVDALLDSPMEVVLASLPLSDEIKDALQHRLGQKGLVLNAVLDYENARFDSLRALIPAGSSAQGVYAEAISWAREAGIELDSAGPAALTP
jgi:EAL and modified HD-GYP domain-containing signal transduction protein